MTVWFDPSDDSGPRLSTQAQAAEDILDKYRNAIKRASPCEGAVVNYDSTGESPLSPFAPSLRQAGGRKRATRHAHPVESLFFSPEAIGDNESLHDGLQNISADDMPDSASQSAQPQDSTFSYRCSEGLKHQPGEIAWRGLGGKMPPAFFLAGRGPRLGHPAEEQV